MAEIVKIEKTDKQPEQYYVGELVYDHQLDQAHGLDGPTGFDGTSQDGFTLDDVRRLRTAAYPNGEPEKVDFYFRGFRDSMMDHRSPNDEFPFSGRATSKELDQALETSADALEFAHKLIKGNFYAVYQMSIIIPTPRTQKT